MGTRGGVLVCVSLCLAHFMWVTKKAIYAVKSMVAVLSGMYVLCVEE